MKRAPAPPGSSAPQKYARVQYDYGATEAGELALKAGQRVKIVQKSGDGAWWRGALDSGEQGWFPSSYVVEEDTNTVGMESSLSSHPELPPRPTVGTAEAGRAGPGISDSVSVGAHSDYSSGGASSGTMAARTEPSDYYSRKLQAFYEQHNPRKLEDPNFISSTLASYQGREHQLFETLNRKYGVESAGAASVGQGIGIGMGPGVGAGIGLAGAGALGAASSMARGVAGSAAGMGYAAAGKGKAAASGSSPGKRGKNRNAIKDKLRSKAFFEQSEVVERLKLLYRKKIKPLEQMYKFNEFHSPCLDAAYFEAPPMVLLLGQYSVGKTTFIR